ncbi:MAG TPA: hypothetical protein VGK20_05650 [Candidatus Binatia bacterium]|jgi:hypothetical protein
MMNAKWIVAAVAVAALSSGCMCAQGHCSRTSHSGGGSVVAEGDLMRIEEAANRAEAAANRAEAAADRAAMAAEKSETVFHKGLRK